MNVRTSWLLFSLVFFFACKNNEQKNNTQQAEIDGLKVPAGFTIEKIVDQKLISFPMFGIFDNDGRMFVFESDGSTPSTEDMLKHPTYHVRRLLDSNNDGIFDKSTIFADSLTIPKGGVFYDGSLYVTAAPDLLRLTDTDSNGVADKREVVQTGWKLDHNAAILGGPFMGPDGWMYMTDARRGYDITTKEGKHLTGRGARIWRCRPDGSGLQPILGGGYDNAIELVFMPGGETIGTMTYFLDPQGGQRDALMHWEEGGVYPKPHAVIQEDSLKLTGELMPVMKKLARVAPSGLMRYHGNLWGDDFSGNLFSAEFNTGKIIRSRISADGATFKTSDEPFVTSTHEDVHPTDIFQDADGSLILINTGGWFIAGCPLSRVAKLDVPGGIYRIRKVDAKVPDDVWGRKINFSSASDEDLAKLVNDHRKFVSDKAIETLVSRKEQAVPAISKIILASRANDTRATGVFMLGRIATANALKSVAAAFDDSSAVVRTAAARVAGLSGDKSFLPALHKMLLQNDLAVRRQASIALEQIGDTSSVAVLLKAAALPNDRYAEHPVIHALIALKSPSSLIAALSNNEPSVRKAAIIALDQMDGYRLPKELIVPFLESNDSTLLKTGLWVTAHHKNWDDVVVNFISKKISAAHSNPGISNLLTQFSDNSRIQQFIATQLQSDSTAEDNAVYYLDVISNSPVKKIPAVWVTSLKKLLHHKNPQLVAKSLTVIQARGVKQVGNDLQHIIFSKDASAEIKLKALAARVATDPMITQREFDLLLSFLGDHHAAPVKQQASRIVAAADLTSAQLTALAKKMNAIDPYLVPTVVQSFDGNMNASTGESLVASLTTLLPKLDNFSEEDINKIFKSYPASVRKSAAPLIAAVKAKNADRLAQLQSVESRLKKGDIGNGRVLFFGKATCSTCHAINSEGSTFAPDLTNIGEIRSQHDILEAIMYPSASFAREHETNKVVTKTNTYTGIIKEQLSDVIVLASGPGPLIRIQRSDVISIEPVNTSLMPAGLDKSLSEQELSDLVAYLASLPDGAGGTIGF